MAHVNYVHSFDEFLSLPQNSKDMEFQAGKDDNHAWKLHIFLDQTDRTVSDPIIKDTVKFLIDNEISFKMGNGGDGGKVFTIYIGEYDKAQYIAKQLNENFGDRYKKDFPRGGIDTSEDMHIFNNIGMRFEGVKDSWIKENEDSSFSYYGYEGIPSLDHNLQFNNMNDRVLSALACHIFLAEKCGTKYLGQNYKKNPWANKIFEDLSTKYTHKEIQDYVSSALKHLRTTHQERFIHKKNLVSPEQGVSLSIDDIIPPSTFSSQINDINLPQTSNSQINISVKNLELMPNADNITIRKNKHGNDILEYKQGDKILASCSLNGEEHCVRLYSDDGSFTEYLTSPKNRTKKIKGEKLYPIANPSLECKIDNIVSFSKAIYEKQLRSKPSNIQTALSQIRQRW
ncbi:MAG: hypothetical protein E7019_00165 [Alphaproteobacteria bacterium]|nr:hypothetical protein [Alphaproteobacteria bacterium]